jgi:acetyltransferase-like isoleucine patch superfamily enzyme
MKERISLVGCANIFLPVIFDVCYDLYGTTEFHIYKNIQVDSVAEMPIDKPRYSLTYVEPDQSTKEINKSIFFGVNGPYAKFNVFNHFHKKNGIGKEDYLTLKHPTSIIAPSSSIAKAVLLEPAVVISSQTNVRFGVTMKRQVSVGHHCDIGEFVEINPGVTISGHVNIGKGSIIGSGSVIRNNITIGENSFIGMGSLVTKDIPAGVVAYGSPCKVVRENNKNLLL